MRKSVGTTRQSQDQRRPRVLIVSPHLTRTLGGITAVVRETLDSPLADAYEFRHIASQADEYGKFRKLILAFTSFIQFVLLLIQWRPAMVIIHVGGNASLYRKLPFIAFARMSGRRALAHFHAGDFEFYFHRQSRFGQRLILRGLGLSHRLVACSSELKRILNARLPEADVVVIPNGVNTIEFETERQPRKAMATDQPVRLLFVGAMGKLKGERDLLRALEEAGEKIPNLKVTLLGHGAESLPKVSELKKVWRLIEHCGPTAMNERAAFYQQADFFVLPTYAEGMPVAVIEAMAAGLPVITTPVGGIPELITDGVEGWLAPPGDVAALTEKIVLLAGNEELRLAMGRLGKLKAQSFDRHVILARMDKVMRQTLAGTVRQAASLSQTSTTTFCKRPRPAGCLSDNF
jgi:glycosyltransferase involved in cell wall biosynthesis